MNKTRKFFLKNEAAFTSILAVVLAFLVVGLLLVSSGRNPFEAFAYFIRGAFGNTFNFANTISRVVPLLIAAIAFIIGAKSSVFNVGIEGQLLLGALASAVVGWAFELPKVIHLPLTLLSIPPAPPTPVAAHVYGKTRFALQTPRLPVPVE